MISNLIGGAGNDILTGTDIGITIEGNDGNDTINGGSGDDIIIGGKGADVINAGDGNNAIYGFLKFDAYLSWPSESWDGNQDQITSGDGNDRILSTGNNIIKAGDGDNYIFEYGGNLTSTFSGNNHNQLGWFNDPIDTTTTSSAWLDLFFVDLGSWNENITSYPEITTGSGVDKVFVYLASKIELGSGSDNLFISGSNDNEKVNYYSGGEGYDKLFIDGQRSFYGGSNFDTPYNSSNTVTFDKVNSIETTLNGSGVISKFDIDFSKIQSLYFQLILGYFFYRILTLKFY